MAVIGGVITSTLLTLIAIPTFYEILDGLRERMMRTSRKVFGGKAVNHVIAAASGEHNAGP